MARKKCNKCKCLLTYDNFGELLSSPDKYNPTCKACRRFIRKASYKRKANGEEPCKPDTTPLRLHNHEQLKILASGTTIEPIEIDAKDVNSNTNYKIVISKSFESWTQVIRQEENLIKGTIFSINVRPDYFFDYLAEFLFKEDIKII